MSKVVIDDSKLVNIADAIRNKNGSANKYTPTEMATAIGEIKASIGAELAPEDLVFSGNCDYKFCYGQWDWFIEKFKDKITTKDITNGEKMFYQSPLSSIPFSLNCKKDEPISLECIFQNCRKMVSVPYINNAKVASAWLMFNGSTYITEIPEDYFDTWDFSYMHGDKHGSLNSMFGGCNNLRKIPSDLSMAYGAATDSFYSSFVRTFQSCYVLDEITNLPVPPVTYSQNMFLDTFSSCSRLKKITFSLNNGIPKTASWQAQVIDLTSRVGYTRYDNLSACGVPLDAEITNDASYQLLKNNKDAWTRYTAYSRYNHDSAVETINTLPDTSAYLAESGGTTNIIKFEGANGSATDGGGINTLTEQEIAVAAAKGWTVTLV